MGQKIIGLDLGTTACKGVVLDAHSQVIASSSSTHRMSSPKPGWAVEDVTEIWKGAVAVLKDLAHQVDVHDFSGICLSGAMHSLIPVDENLQPLAAAMTWADNRSAAIAKNIRSQIKQADLLMRVGCPLQHVYNPARLRWWVEEQPEITRKTRHFIAIKDWVAYQLTGKLATDIGLASTTGLLDINSYKWDDEAVNISGVSKDQLPGLVSPVDKIGGLIAEASELTGLPQGLPVFAGTTDGGLANLGSKAILPGQRIVTIGTSGAVRKIVDQPWVDPGGRTWCYVLVKGRWFIGGAINNGGLTLQWIREKFYADIEGDKAYDQLNQDAGSISAGSDGVMMLPYLTGERSPYWNPDANAVLVGLSLQHTRGHIARAAMEGVAFCIADVWDILHEEQKDDDSSVYLTGGVNRESTWPQIIANVLGVRLIQIEIADASAIGAAMLGKLAAGEVNSLDDMVVRKDEKVNVNFDPKIHQLYRSEHNRFNALYQALETGNRV